MRDEGGELAKRHDRWVTEGFAAAAKTDPRAALAAALEMTNPRARDHALGGVVKGGSFAPDEIPELLAKCSPLTARQIMRDAINALPMNTPAELEIATDVLLASPANENALRLTEGLARKWAELDWDQGWGWADSIPDIAMRRRAVEALAERANAEQLDSLAEKIATVPPVDLSNRFFQTALRRIPDDQQEAWIRRLPPAHAAWAQDVRQAAAR